MLFQVKRQHPKASITRTYLSTYAEHHHPRYSQFPSQKYCKIHSGSGKSRFHTATLHNRVNVCSKPAPRANKINNTTLSEGWRLRRCGSDANRRSCMDTYDNWYTSSVCHRSQANAQLRDRRHLERSVVARPFATDMPRKWLQRLAFSLVL